MTETPRELARFELEWAADTKDWESGWLLLELWDVLATVTFGFAPTGITIFPITHYNGEDWTSFHLRYDAVCGIVSLVHCNFEDRAASSTAGQTKAAIRC